MPGSDTLTGTDAGLTYTVTGANAGTVSTILPAGFTGVETPDRRGPGPTRSSSPPGTLSGQIDGGAGTDRLVGDDTARTLHGHRGGRRHREHRCQPGSCAWRSSGAAPAADTFAFGASGSLTGTITGGAGSDTLIGTDAGLTFTVTGADAGTVSTILPAGFAAVENLTGGTGADTFTFAGGSSDRSQSPAGPGRTRCSGTTPPARSP